MRQVLKKTLSHEPPGGLMLRAREDKLNQSRYYPELLPEFRIGGGFGGRQAGIGLFDAFLLSFGAADPRMSQEKERGEKKKKRKRRENPDFEFDCGCRWKEF